MVSYNNNEITQVIACNLLFIRISQIHSVEQFVCSVNANLTTRQENERLKGIMARIESYDVAVSKYMYSFESTKLN